MNKNKSNHEQLKSRGYIEDQDMQLYLNFNKEQLCQLLQSKTPVERTIAARLLSQYKDKETIECLMNRLAVEKKLYTKIELTESISLFGEDACPLLVHYLGQIGNNQHTQLPDKPFNKKNYPLPRDIAARTLCKIGVPALSYLKNCLENSEYKQITEAIDAIGFISYYEKNEACLFEIIKLFSIFQNDNLVIWKLIRALQAFNHPLSIEKLNTYKDSHIKQLQWEAERSLNQLEI